MKNLCKIMVLVKSFHTINKCMNGNEIFMPDQKLDNLLNLAMDATSQERAKSENLNVGYDPTTRLWDVIVKYSESERRTWW